MSPTGRGNRVASIRMPRCGGDRSVIVRGVAGAQIAGKNAAASMGSGKLPVAEVVVRMDPGPLRDGRSLTRRNDAVSISVAGGRTRRTGLRRKCSDQMGPAGR